MSVSQELAKEVQFIDAELEDLYLEKERIHGRILALLSRSDTIERAWELVKLGESTLRIQTGQED